MKNTILFILFISTCPAFSQSQELDTLFLKKEQLEKKLEKVVDSIMILTNIIKTKATRLIVFKTTIIKASLGYEVYSNKFINTDIFLFYYPLKLYSATWFLPEFINRKIFYKYYDYSVHYFGNNFGVSTSINHNINNKYIYGIYSSSSYCYSENIINNEIYLNIGIYPKRDLHSELILRVGIKTFYKTHTFLSIPSFEIGYIVNAFFLKN